MIVRRIYKKAKTPKIIHNKIVIVFWNSMKRDAVRAQTRCGCSSSCQARLQSSVGFFEILVS